jgi:hypothetical protein
VIRHTPGGVEKKITRNKKIILEEKITFRQQSFVAWAASLMNANPDGSLQGQDRFGLAGNPRVAVGAQQRPRLSLIASFP